MQQFGEPIEAVIFDFHQTLVDAGRSEGWLDDAWRVAGRRGVPADEWGDERTREVKEFLADVWRLANSVDPHSERDLSRARHQKVWDETLTLIGGIDPDVADALYATMDHHWVLYADTVPTLRALRSRGIRIGLLSNIGIDLRDTLRQQNALDLFDAVVLSYEVGAVKPQPRIFERILAQLRVPPQRALMVGDSWAYDAGGADIGVRTLLLPRTVGDHHGLGLVLRLVGLA